MSQLRNFMHFRWISEDFHEKAWLDFRSNCSWTLVGPGSRLIEFGKANANDLRVLEDVLWRQNPEHITSTLGQIVDFIVALVSDGPFCWIGFASLVLMHLIEFKIDRGMEIAWDSKISNST